MNLKEKILTTGVKINFKKRTGSFEIKVDSEKYNNNDIYCHKFSIK